MKKILLLFFIVLLLNPLNITFASTQKNKNLNKDEYTFIPSIGTRSWNIDKLINKYNIKNNYGKGVNIAIIDSGIDKNHSDFKKFKFKENRSFIPGEQDTSDRIGHGTSIAGEISQLSPGATFNIYKAYSKDKSSMNDIATAIIYAVKHNNNIINLSFGSVANTHSSSDIRSIRELQKAINYAHSKNVIVVAAAGNEGKNYESLKKEGYKYIPGDLENVITVGSISEDDTVVLPYSNQGKSVELLGYGGGSNAPREKYKIEDLLLLPYPQNLDNHLTVIGLNQGYTLTYGTSLSCAETSAMIANDISLKKHNTKYWTSDKYKKDYIFSKHIRL